MSTRLAHGDIYILSNPCMPGLVMIGVTDTQHSSKEQAALLSKSAAIPKPFAVEYNVRVESPAQHEQSIHVKLHHCRVAHDKSFFHISLSEAIKALEHVVSGNGDNSTGKDQWIENWCI